MSGADGRVTIVTEDPGDPDPRVIDAGPLPGYLWTTWLTQRYRARRYLRVVRRLNLPPATPLVFNNVINAAACAAELPHPTVGFINDYNNLPSERGRYRWTERLGKRLLADAERRAARRVDRVVVNSRFMKDRISAAYGLSPAKIDVLYKGLAIPPDAPPVRPFVPGQPTELLFVKSDFRRGGLPDLLKALFRLPSDRSYHLAVVGTTRAAYTAQLGKLTSPSHVRITWLGRIAQAEVRTLMDRAHIFCSPARSEALGVANMEAMTRRCRTITTDVGGIPEVTDGGNNCVVVPPNQPEAIVRAIITLEAEPYPVAEARAALARTYIIDHFDESLAYQRLLSIVAKVQR